MSSTIYVGQLSYDATEDDVARVFEEYNLEFDKISVPQDHGKGRSRGFAFVDMRNQDDVQRALQEIGNIEICGRAVFMREKEEKGGKGKGGKGKDYGRDRDDYRGGGRYDDDRRKGGDKGKGKRDRYDNRDRSPGRGGYDSGRW